MNKLSYLIMGFAALSFAACSSDEPTPAPTPGEGEGTTLYLNVNITDANTARSRAAGYDQEGQPKDPAQEGDYVFGNEDEHAINSADFLFYDKDGRFLTRTNIWQAGTGNDAPNIEYMGTNTLVLRNLSKNNLPPTSSPFSMLPQTSHRLSKQTTGAWMRLACANFPSSPAITS